MTCWRRKAVGWLVLLTFAQVCEAQQPTRRDWSRSRVASGQIQHDLPAVTQALSRRLNEINSQNFPRSLTVKTLVKALNSSGIPTIVDRNSLEDENVDLDDKLRLPAANVSLGQGVEVALKERGLGWTITKRGDVVMVASRARIEEELINVTYDVSQLCASDYDADSLINVVTSTVSPDCWDDVGGPCTVQFLDIRGRTLLVTSAEYEVQVDLLRLLNSLRQMGGNGLHRRSSSIAVRTNLVRTNSVPYASAFGSSSGSTPISLPTTGKKRGIALPASGIQGGFGGGMAGGMF